MDNLNIPLLMSIYGFYFFAITNMYLQNCNIILNSYLSNYFIDKTKY